MDRKHRYNDKQWYEITHADCVETARALGLQFDERRSGNDAIRIADFHGGLFIWRSGKGWYQHSTEEKGKAVDLVMKIQGCDYAHALNFISDNVLHNPSYDIDREMRRRTIEEKKPIEKGEFALPEQTDSAKQVFAYLAKTRCIDPMIIRMALKQRIIFQTAKHNNCCFVSYDKENKPRYAALRGIYTSAEPFKGEVKNSDKQYGWKMMSEQHHGSKLYVFEAPIDAMSHASLYVISGRWNSKTEGTRLALGGVSLLALRKHLEEYPDRYDEIVVCTDNDEQGNLCEKKIREEFSEHFKISRKKSKLKDWNEDLQQMNHIAQEKQLPLRNAMQEFYQKEPVIQSEETNEIEL